MKDPTEELTGIFSSLWLWDISLTLNMTYFLSPIVLPRYACNPLPPKEEAKPHVILNDSEGSHRRTDKAYTILTLVVGYFAYAQYDVLF